jgi:hypothetical protein
MRRIFIILSVLLLVSCSESLDIQLEPEVNMLLSNDREQRIRLTPKDKAYTSLNEWLREHRSGWHPTSGPYPGGVYIKSGGYGIQVTETHVILYSTTSPKPRSIYIQKVARGELGSIKNIINETGDPADD